MAEGLVENLGGHYSEDEGVLRGEPNIVKVWVEDEFDTPFWYDLLTSFNSIYKFEITPYDNGNISKGKSNILAHANSLGRRFIACVDSDYNYLIDTTDEAQTIFSSSFILHTYVYSIENYLCHAKTLGKVCVNSTMLTSDFEKVEQFIVKYSEIIYPVFIWHLFSISKCNIIGFDMKQFSGYTSINKIVTANFTIENYLDDLTKKIYRKHSVLSIQYRHKLEEIEVFKEEMRLKGLTPENCYLFIQGHLLFDSLSKNVLFPLINKAKSLHAKGLMNKNGESESKKQIINHYLNNTKNTFGTLLSSNYEYKNHCEIYKNKLKIDVENMIANTFSLA